VPEIDTKPVLNEINPVFTEAVQDEQLGIVNGLAGVSAHDASRPVASRGYKFGQRQTTAIRGD